MKNHASAFFLQAAHGFKPALKGGTAKDHFGPKGASAFHFVGCCIIRHDDAGLDSQSVRGPGHGLREVAGRSGEDPAISRRFKMSQDSIQRGANLVGPGRLAGFKFEINITTRPVGEGVRF
jgi:hypothetical protein